MFPVLNGVADVEVGMAQVRAEKNPSKSGIRYSNWEGEANFGVWDGLRVHTVLFSLGSL